MFELPGFRRDKGRVGMETCVFRAEESCGSAEEAYHHSGKRTGVAEKGRRRKKGTSTTRLERERERERADP